MAAFSTTNTFVVVLILLFSIANYYHLISRFRELDRTLQKVSGKLPELTDDSLDLKLSDRFEIRELRRSALLSADKIRQEVLRHARGEDNKKFYSKIKEEAFCERKMRVGGKGDGGKVACDPARVNDDCTLLSLGLNNQIDYDFAIMNVTNRKCIILGADKDAQNLQTQRAYISLQGQIFTGKIPDELKISEILERRNRKEVEILKIDIEGNEHEALEPFLSQFFVCQILIEIHGFPPEQLAMLQKIARYGFRLFNIEPNVYCARCCEYSLINELCMHQFGAVPLAINIPQNDTIH